MIATRRSFLLGMGAALVASPAVIRLPRLLMPVRRIEAESLLTFEAHSYYVEGMSDAECVAWVNARLEAAIAEMMRVPAVMLLHPNRRLSA